MKDASSDKEEWQALAAGYLVLRIFDDWLTLGPHRITTDMSFSKILTTITELPERYQQERRILQATLQMLMDAPELEPSSIVGPLFGYGALLEARGTWAQAADVYQTILKGLESFSTSPDFSSIATAYVRTGACLANTQKYDQAAEAYRNARIAAGRAQNQMLQIHAQMLLANVTHARGDLPGAEAMLNDLLEDTLDCPPDVTTLVRPSVLHTRGAVRNAREHYVEAITDHYEAYLHTNDPLTRELILADLGASASAAGYRDTARDALEIIVLSGRNPLARQSTIVNLIEIAVLDGDQAAFERRRAEWQPTQCNPQTNACAKLYIARGVERFVGRDEALAAFHEVAHFAEEAGIHQVQFEALSDIERLQRLAVADIQKATPVPPSLNYIAEALADLRMLAAKDG